MHQAILVGVAFLAGFVACHKFIKEHNYLQNTCVSSISEMIGNTPMLYLKLLSKRCKADIYVKCEFMNITGSGKDRIARAIVKEASCANHLVEGTSGSTGISICALANSSHNSFKTTIFMPDDQNNLKYEIIKALGAKLVKTQNASISNDTNYVSQAKHFAKSHKYHFCDQFDNLINYKTQYAETGKEILQQTKGKIDFFVMSAGTGGTITGVGLYLKENIPGVKVVLADPQGSSLHSLINFRTAYSNEQAEQSIKKHRYDSIVEGIGLDRITKNLQVGIDNNVIDFAIKISDAEVKQMASKVASEEGLLVCSSGALNLCACEKIAVESRMITKKKLRIVTIVSSSGNREVFKLFNA